MTYKNKTTIYSFIIRHSFPNLLYVTCLHDVLYVCTSSICFCSPKETIMKIRSILTTLRNPFSMTYKNKTTIYSFIIRHSFPNLLYVTCLHDVLYVCTSSICFCSPKETIMKIRSILTCIMLSLPQYLNCKTFRCVYCFL